MVYAAIGLLLPSLLHASPNHDVAAANLNVIQNDTGNTAASVTVTAENAVNDFRMRDGSNRGDYNIQIGDNPNDDVANGILISSIAQNGGRDNGEGTGVNFCISTVEIAPVTYDGNNTYFVPTFALSTNTTGVASLEYNINVSAAYFPYSTWIGGLIRIAGGVNGAFGNGITNNEIIGTAGLAFGQNVKPLPVPAAGKLILDLSSFGVDSRTDGVLLVCGGKNEGNYALSQANLNDGTWNLYTKDKDSNGASTEEDPIAFVFVPKTNTAVVSGRFHGDASIAMHSGDFPEFTVANTGTGSYELKVPGKVATNGVLIISAEGGTSINQDNIVSFQLNSAGDGWIIQSRDGPLNANGVAGLQSPPATDAVVSFVFIPGPALPAVNTSTLGLSVVEGQTNGYTVVLATEPSGNVVINLASGNTTQGGTVAPATLTFTPSDWDVPQAVTVTGIDDLVMDGNTVFTITHTSSSSDPNYAALEPTIVTVTTLDNEAAITLPSGEMIYGIGLGGVGIDGRASIIDPYSSNYNGGTLAVSLTVNGTSDDRLEIRNTGTGSGQIGVSGNTVSYEGTTIGTFSGGVGTTPLTITLNSAATPTATEALLRNVTFRNVNSSPSISLRVVSVVLTNSQNGVSTATKSIRISLLRATSFQEGVDAGYGVYAGGRDTYLREADPNTPYPAGNANGQLFVDFPAIGGVGGHVLMAFDNIIGSGPGQVPTNAIIVSADLFVTITDTGHGSPLYRMLRDWDATNETWSSIGSGVDQDDIESRSTYDSQIGTAFPNGATTVGTVSVSVLPDVIVWQSGSEENFGWAMPGYLGNNNGTGILPSETSVASQRPKLRVLWVPGETATASFRQNVNDYASAFDTQLRQTTPDTEFSASVTLSVDAEVTGGFPNPSQVLLRFDDIIGNSAGQIPANSQIHAAVVDFASVVSDAMGQGGTFHAMLQPWSHTDTWNTLTDGIVADGTQALAIPTITAGSPTLLPHVQGGYHTFELTPDVQAWASGTRPNYGWAILPWPGGGNGWFIGSADTTVERERPQLRVYYTPGVPSIVIQSITRTATTVTLEFGGEIGVNYSVRRASTVDGTYNVIGSATVQPNGKATFIDNSPPAGSAFYRISNP